MKIKQLTLNNIGSFAGEHTFLFQTDGTQKQIVLIGGRNGAGKTTLFDSIRLCLYGYKLYGYRQNSQTYTNKIKRLINDKVKTTSPATAGIVLQILIEDGYANSIFEINREWTLSGNTLKENLCVYKDGDLLSTEQMQDFDNYLMQIIPPALFNFHFFDGEKVSNFVFDRANGQAFRKAFLQICSLDTFDLIEEQLRYNTRTTKGDSQSLVEEEYETAREKRAKAKEEYTFAFQRMENVQEEIDALQDQIALLDENMRKYGGIENHNWKLYEKEIQEEEAKRNELRHILKTAANDVIPFVILKEQLEALKIQLTVEEKLKRNRLLKDKFSDPHLKEKLQQELVDFPYTEISDRFMLSLYKTLREDIPEDGIEFLKISENDSMELLAKIHHYQNYDVQSLLDAEKSLEKSLAHTKELRAQMDSKEVIDSNYYLLQKNELLMRLDALRQQSLVEKDCLFQKESMLQTTEKVYQKAYEKYRAMLKEKSVSDMAARALLAFSELKQNLYTKYISQVEDAFSRNFHNLISKTDLIDGIYIDSAFEIVAYKMQEVDVSHVLKQIQEYGKEYLRSNIGERAYKIIQDCNSSNGKIIVPIKVEQHFSAGEHQIFVMALYQSLAEIRTSELPFVIDTPLARIDSEHRRNILVNFFSQLPGQVIILSTDEEINNEGLSVLSPKISDVYLIEHQENSTTSVHKGSYFKGVIA
ncbi:ATP-binding protein [Anaerotignum lactatifermentans]|uniref:ATP-binding protein n=1 Tax=Anaerotignum lactatifermentans TaxID=160404 RepID=UPI002671E553|nr:AAA family ATPase [Anaerotignum lactatifermentans]